MTKLITPIPAIAAEELPHIGAGLRFLDSPTEYLLELRQKHGDSFFVDIFGFPMLFLFSPQGLESLYKLEEDQASFGMATFDMIGFKTPLEVFMDADIDLFYKLLAHKKMPAYVAIMNDVVEQELLRWGEQGHLDLFDAIRTLEQRVGYALWICPLAATDAYWPKLKQHFDVLNQESAFVDPGEILETVRSGKKKEREAIAAIGKLLAEIMEQHDGQKQNSNATVDHLRELFQDEDEQVTFRKVLHNTLNANQGFLSNLYAGIAWSVYQTVAREEVQASVSSELKTVLENHGAKALADIDALNAMRFTEQVFMESVRVAQRSLTLRKVMKSVTLETEQGRFDVSPGVYIATMLSVTNVQTQELARFDPGHYEGNRLSAKAAVDTKETVSTFGHGKHACPAQRFSHHMCKIVLGKILQNFDLSIESGLAEPSRSQMGGVSRPQASVMISYQRKLEK